jgi:hypothetical protein
MPILLPHVCQRSCQEAELLRHRATCRFPVFWSSIMLELVSTQCLKLVFLKLTCIYVLAYLTETFCLAMYLQFFFAFTLCQ